MYNRKTRGWAKHIDFIILDLLSLCISLILSYIIRMGMKNPFEDPTYRILFCVVIMIDLIVMIITNLYQNVLKRGYYRELRQAIFKTIAVLLLTVLYMFFTKTGDHYSRIIVGMFMIIYGELSYIVTMLWKMHLSKVRKMRSGSAILIIASEATATDTIRTMKQENIDADKIIGVVVHDAYKIGREVEGVPIVACYDDVAYYVRTHWVDEVLVSTLTEDILPDEVINELLIMGVTVHINLRRYTDVCGAKQEISVVDGMQVITTSMNFMNPGQKFLKRTLDIMGGLVGCMFTGIIYLFVAPAIRKESPGPVFFTQTRIGQNGRAFKFYKFRSMYLDAEERKKELMAQNRIKDGLMFKMEFDPRIIGNRIDPDGTRHTGIGEFIRKYSLDEFPQFYNVLKGDMSLVGTRPPLVDEYKQYQSHHKARLAAKPGITGMWQVSGRSDILDFEEVVKLDTEYINNWNFGLDIKILLKTVSAVFRKEGAM